MNKQIKIFQLLVRILFPLVFIGGYAITCNRYEDIAVEYFLWHLLALTSCAVVLGNIGGVQYRHAGIWMVLSIFLAVNVVRFYWLAIDPTAVKIMMPSDSYTSMNRSPDALYSSFILMVISFTLVCLSMVILDRWVKTSGYPCEVDSSVQPLACYKPVVKYFPITVFIAMMVLGYAAHHFHIGEMGAASGDPLPFRLKGIIFYMRTVVIPILILTIIFAAGKVHNFRVARLGIGLLIAHGLLDMVIRGSRSSLLLVLLLLFFLVISKGITLLKTEKIGLGIAVVFAMFMVPLMTQYRTMRVAGGLSVLDALGSAFDKLGANWLIEIFHGIRFVFFRMPGIESVWAMKALHAEPLYTRSLDVISDKMGVAGYLTYYVHPGMYQSDNTLLAPGYIGWFYLVAGISGVVLGSIIMGAVAAIGWNFVSRSGSRSGAVGRVFYFWMLFLALTEGTLDSMRYMLAVGVGVIFLLEIWFRYLSRDECLAADVAQG